MHNAIPYKATQGHHMKPNSTSKANKSAHKTFLVLQLMTLDWAQGLLHLSIAMGMCIEEKHSA